MSMKLNEMLTNALQDPLIIEKATKNIKHSTLSQQIVYKEMSIIVSNSSLTSTHHITSPPRTFD